MPKYDNLKEYMYGIADYISWEYGTIDDGQPLSDDEKYVIRQMSLAHYESNDNAANAANYIIEYLRTSRKWVKELNGLD